MKIYSRPLAEVIRFENEDKNMVLLSGNYNANNIIRSDEVNQLNN